MKEEIILKLKCDELVRFSNLENNLSRKIALCHNRLSLYYTGLCFMFGWFFFMIFSAANSGVVDGSQIFSDVSSNLISSKGIFSILFAIFTMWGLIIDTFILFKLKFRYKKLLKNWSEHIKNE